MAKIENLTSSESDTALRFFFHHLGPDLRGRFMAEMPTIYAKVFPSVTAERLLEIVSERIATDRVDMLVSSS